VEEQRRREKKKRKSERKDAGESGAIEKKSVKGVRWKEGDGVRDKLVRASVTNVTKVGVGPPVAP